MTLEEFIIYFEEQSKEHTNLVPYDVDEKYNRNCKQLAEWLRELKKYRAIFEKVGKILADNGYTIDDLDTIFGKVNEEVNADDT